jgi:murein hydrolase activator
MTTCLVLCALLVGSMQAQTISSKKQELERLRSSIKSTQQKIDRLSREERSKRSSLTAYQRQRHQISGFIVSLEADLQRLKDSAARVQQQIRSTREALRKAESDFNALSTKMLVYMKERKGNPRSNVRTDALFRSMSEQLTLYRRKMTRLQDSLAAEEDLLQAYSDTRDSVLSTMATEERRLSSSIHSSKQEITKIRRDRSSLNKELAEKQQSANALRNLINKLVADARRKAEEERRRRAARTGKKPPEEPTSVAGFPAKSLPWPTSSNRILHGYGSYTNPQTGTTLDNPGVDIASAVGSSIRSVANGEVTSVTFLPGFQSLVIVDHGNGVRSVYANLETVNVGVGTSVKAGTILGKSGESIDGPLLHFEIWNGKQRQNPLKYLR